MSRDINFRRFSMNIPRVEQDRLQGWLTVANAIETDCLDQLEWHKRYCVLAKDERKLYFYNDTESVLNGPPHSPPVKFNFDEAADGACQSSHRKNALTYLDPSFSNFQRGTRQTRSFREKVKSSLQKSVKRNSKQENTLQLTGPVGGGGSVRVSRSRSFGKVDRIDQTLTLPGLKLGHSMENLHRVSSHGTAGESHYTMLGEHGTFLDLATRGTLSILPIHQSVSPRHSCFRIITDSDILYASCGSKEELDKWLTNLGNCQRPNRNHLRRLDTHLSLWILEARNLQPKKRYFCEIYLNGIIYAQTCCKVMNEILFWGEPFVFSDLPPLGSVIVKIYRENYNKKKREKTPATDIGKVEMPALVLESGQLMEKWYPINMYQPARGYGQKERDKEVPSVRFKIQYQVVSILPLKTYDDFLKYMKTDYGVVCEVLEPIISAKAKDEIAQTLVRILQVVGKAKEFLCDIIMSEVEHTENENLIFRGNTFATKAVDTYMKMVGDTYLREALTPFICYLLEMEDDCEVDPMKLSPGANLQHNQAALNRLVSKAWNDILSSYTKFPSDLRNTLHGLRQRFGAEREDACFKLISGSIFLRFLCPAILSPSLFQLCQEYPSEKMSRKLTLVAKVIQNLANFTRFGVKEEYMLFMNEFVEREIKIMKEFINIISSPVPESEPHIDWGPCHIDLGREASIMHGTLVSQLKSLKLSEESAQRLQPLCSLLEQLTRVGEEEEGDPFSSTFEALRVMQSTISKFNSGSGAGGGDPENSDSSSEYTTPAESQTTSPNHEQSPPPPFVTAQVTRATLGSAVQILNQNAAASSSESSLLGGTASSSTTSPPSTSPTHSGGVSRLATHSHMAGGGGGPSKSKTSPPGVRGERGGAAARDDSGSGVRRLSDSELQRHRVKPKHSQGAGGSVLPVPSHVKASHNYSRSIDETMNIRADNQEISELRAENGRLREEIDRLKLQLTRQQEDYEKELERLRKADEGRRKSEQELKNLKDSRGKILRGLNTQTEIALVQFKRDFDHLQKQLQAKDEIINVQEKKIAALVEANCTLRHGLKDLNSLPKHEDSDSDLEEEIRQSIQSLSNGNGHLPPGVAGNSASGQIPQNSELQKMISQLDSGKFEFEL